MKLTNSYLSGLVSLTSDITIDITESRITGKIYGTLEPECTDRTIETQNLAAR